MAYLVDRERIGALALGLGVGGRAAALLALATGCFGGTLLVAQDLLRPRSFPSLAVPGAGRWGRAVRDAGGAQ